MLAAACGPGRPEPGDETSGGSSDTSGADTTETPTTGSPVALCGDETPTCGSQQCVVEDLVVLADPSQARSDRPTLVVDAGCRPHALVHGFSEQHEFFPFYYTTHDGAQWYGEMVPLPAVTAALFVDPDGTPVVVGQRSVAIESVERRDGTWRAAVFSGAGSVEGAARTADGITHIQFKHDRDHMLRRFASDGTELETVQIGRNVSVAHARLAVDRDGKVIQTAFTDQPDFNVNLGTRWWSDGHGVEPTDLEFISALAAAGDAEHPRAGLLGFSVSYDLWFARRGAAWSYWPVASRPYWDPLPADPVDGQIVVRHIREVLPIAVVVDLTGEYRWIWSEIERDEPWVAHIGNTVGWSVHGADVSGTSALWIGWLDAHGEARRAIISDSLAVRSGDAAIDASGRLHLLVMDGPLRSAGSDLLPTYLRLGV